MFVQTSGVPMKVMRHDLSESGRVLKKEPTKFSSRKIISVTERKEFRLIVKILVRLAGKLAVNRNGVCVDVTLRKGRLFTLVHGVG